VNANGGEESDARVASCGYKQWDATDVRKILNDSPWSKPVETERKEKKHGLEAPAGAPKVAGVPGEDEEDEQEEKNDEPQIGEKDKKKDDVKFLVRWVSSRTLREASIHGQVLQGRIAEADEDKTLPPAADDYELALVGTDMSSFRGADESTLRDKTYLTAKKSKERITASQVEIVRASDGKRITAIVFHFPKKSAAGAGTGRGGREGAQICHSDGSHRNQSKLRSPKDD
jgi:hypothetical protein